MVYTNAEIERVDRRMSEIHAQLTALDRAGDWTTAQRSLFDSLNAEINKLDDTRARAVIREAAKDPARREEVGIDTGTIQRPTEDRAGGQARRTIDTAARSGLLPDHAAQRATALVEHGSLYARREAAAWVNATGDPEYLGAFAKLVADPDRGHLLWSGRERAAFASVQEYRAASLTDAAGGYMVPFTLDPAVILTSAGSINPLRRIARVVQTATDTWNGVSSAGVTASWDAEAAEVSDDAPTVAGPSIPVHKGAAFVPYSIEVGMDALRFVEEISRLLLDGADVLQLAAFTTGTGTGQPTGIITALAGTASEINGGGTEALAVGDPLLLQNALPPRFQGNAQWCANIAILNTIGAFETTNGALRFPEVADGQLLRKPLHELSDMDGSINAVVTANNYVLLYGDFRNFVIADRIGTTIEPIAHLFGASGRPTGQRGLYLYFRTGSDSVNDNAFRLLDVPTTL